MAKRFQKLQRDAVYGKRKYQGENRVVKKQHALWGTDNVLLDYTESEDERPVELNMSCIQKTQPLYHFKINFR